MIAFRPLEERDIAEVIALWTDCGLVRPWNDAGRDVDFARGKASSDILVGIVNEKLVASVMVGHDGHRGWFYYLSVAPDWQGKGLGTATLRAAEAWLKDRGIWAVNLAIRSENDKVRAFYAAHGYELRDVIVMGRRDLDQ